MYYLIAKTVTMMQRVYMACRFFFWNYHIDRARLHDDKMCCIDPDWKNALQATPGQTSTKEPDSRGP